MNLMFMLATAFANPHGPVHVDDMPTSRTMHVQIGGLDEVFPMNWERVAVTTSDWRCAWFEGYCFTSASDITDGGAGVLPSQHPTSVDVRLLDCILPPTNGTNFNGMVWKDSICDVTQQYQYVTSSVGYVWTMWARIAEAECSYLWVYQNGVPYPEPVDAMFCEVHDNPGYWEGTTFTLPWFGTWREK